MDESADVNTGFGLAIVKQEGTIRECETGNIYAPGDEGYDDRKSRIAEARASDGIVLSTGRNLYANRLILGIGPDLALYEGYDGGIDEAELTQAERVELAKMAIERWQRFIIVATGGTV